MSTHHPTHPPRPSPRPGPPSHRPPLLPHPAPPSPAVRAPAHRPVIRPPGPRRALTRLARSWRRAWPALLLHTALRAAAVGWVAWGARDVKGGLYALLAARFDTVYYLQIAEDGYSAPPEQCALGASCRPAFFPLYPLLIRHFTRATGLPPGWVAWGLALTASLLAAWGVHAVVDRMYGPRAAVYCVALWAVVPHALVSSMAYTEPLFTALAAWALYAVLARSWTAAGLLALLAGTTRPSGIALVAAVTLCAACAGWAACAGRYGDRRWRTVAAPWACVVLAPLGWGGYVAWTGYRLGRWDGYLAVQRDWGSTFDGGVETLRHLAGPFTGAAMTLNTVVVAITVCSALTLLAVCARQRLPLPLWLYAAMLVLITVGGAGYFHAKARFLLPAFPLLIPFARALAGARPATSRLVLGCAAVLSAFYSGYLALVWPYSP